MNDDNVVDGDFEKESHFFEEPSCRRKKKILQIPVAQKFRNFMRNTPYVSCLSIRILLRC